MSYKVHLTVYDINKNCNQSGADMIGFGIYHSGVQIGMTEYTFGGNTTIRSTGVVEHPPKEYPEFDYKQSIYIGEIKADMFFKGKSV